MKPIVIISCLIGLFLQKNLKADPTQVVQDIPNEWRKCRTAQECAVGVRGCYEWVIVNKAHLLIETKSPFEVPFVEGGFAACKKSRDPGEKPHPLTCEEGYCKILLPGPTTTFDEIEHAKSLGQDKCPCWDGTKKRCLPQSACF